MKWPWKSRKKDFRLGIQQDSSKTFCMLPWIHLYALPNGDVLPCCVAPYDKPMANLKEASFSEIWNCDDIKALRRNMLNNEKSSQCTRCYDLEQQGAVSSRQIFNRDYAHLYDSTIPQTKRDGSLKDMKLYYLDLRFSNICNLKCLGCSPTLSSSWFDDYHQLKGEEGDASSKIAKLSDLRDTFWQELEGILPSIERAYFAGGEPLLMPEHFRCLDIFLKKKKNDVMLFYNSNFMVMDSCGKSIFDYWKQFKFIKLSISIDDINERAEYFRFGTKWDRLIDNIQTVKKECPHVSIEVTCTVNFFNIHRLTEIHHYLYSQDFIDENGFFLNFLTTPQHLCSYNAPAKQKSLAKEKIQNYLGEIKTKHPEKNWQPLEQSFREQVAFMEKESNAQDYSKLKSWIKDLDNIRKTSVGAAYPELDSYLKD